MQNFMRLALLGLFQMALASGAAAADESPAERDVAITLQDRQIQAAGIETQPIEQESGSSELVVPGVVVVPAAATSHRGDSGGRSR